VHRALRGPDPTHGKTNLIAAVLDRELISALHIRLYLAQPRSRSVKIQGVAEDGKFTAGSVHTTDAHRQYRLTAFSKWFLHAPFRKVCIGLRNHTMQISAQTLTFEMPAHVQMPIYAP